MTTYEITFIYKSNPYRERITAHNPMRVRELIRARYPGAKIMYVKVVK